MLKSNSQDVMENSQSHKFQLKQEPIRTILYNEIDRYNEEAIKSVHAKMQAQKALQRNKREFPSYPGE